MFFQRALIKYYRTRIYIQFIAKDSEKNIGFLCCSSNSLALSVILCLYKTQNNPKVAYYCHVKTGAFQSRLGLKGSQCPCEWKHIFHLTTCSYKANHRKPIGIL